MNAVCRRSYDGFFASGRLWSLLEIMRRLSLNEFIAAFQQLSAYQQGLVTARNLRPNLNLIPTIHESDFRGLQGSARMLAKIIEENGMSVAFESIRKILEILDSAQILNSQVEFEHATQLKLENFCKDMISRVGDEFASRYVLIIAPEKTRYYEPVKPPFGKDVENKFPSSMFDIDEAGKCYAVGLYTASVFHLMRVMELGIRAVARCLNIQDPVKPAERNWGFIIKEIKAEIEARGKSSPRPWSNPAEKLFFEDMHVSLDAVRNVWRNATMHVEKTYTDDEAEHIYGAVRGFMSKLANRVDEQGQPSA